jgi:hypothetical protein
MYENQNPKHARAVVSKATPKQEYHLAKQRLAKANMKHKKSNG